MSRSSSIVSCGEQTHVLDPNIDIKFEPVFEREDEEERIDFDQIAYESSRLAPTCVLGYDQCQTIPVIDANSEIVVKIDPNHVLGMENELHDLSRTKTLPPLRLRAIQKRTRNEPDPEYTLSSRGSRSESGRKNKRAKGSTKQTRKEKGGGRKTSAKKTSKPKSTPRRANSTISNENSRNAVKNTTEAVEVEETNWEPLIVPEKLKHFFRCFVQMKRTSNSTINKFIKTKEIKESPQKATHRIMESVPIIGDEFSQFSDFNPGSASPDRLASDDENDRFEEYQPSNTHIEIGHPIPSTTEIKRSKSGQIITCLECHKSFTRPTGLAYHMKVMHGNKPPDREFECEECGKSYHKKSHLDQHRRCHESKDRDEPWTQRKSSKTTPRARSSQGRNFPKSQCEFCQRVFSRPSGLAYHQKQEPSSPPLTCKVCPQTFKLANCLNYHIQENHPESTTLIKIVSGVKRSDAGLFNCTECGKGFTRHSGLAYHMRVKHTNQPMERKFVCDECGKTFLQKCHLTEHRRSHPIDGKSEPERVFACEYCDKTFIWKNHLLKHQKSHTGEKFQCRHCSAESTTTYQRAIHEKLEHGIVTATATKKTNRPVNKNRRLNCTHMGCVRFFHTLQSLQIHERTHTGEKPYLCCECGAAYKSSNSLRDHINSVHTGLKPYSCPDPTCGEKFARILVLKQHVLTKHEALATKKFPCEFCSMKFFTRVMLIRHKRKHTGERPFSCHMCTSTFTQSYRLYAHLKRCGVVSSSADGEDQTSPKLSVIKPSKPRKRQKIPKHLRPPPQKLEKIHPCHFCPKFFSRLQDATRHEKSVHTGEDPFVCVKCRSRFRTRYRLNVHKKMHENGEEGDLTPGVCPYCSKTFVQRERLNNHIRLKHPGQAEVLETPIQCVPARPIPTFPTPSGSQHHSLSRLAESIGQLRAESDSYYGTNN